MKISKARQRQANTVQEKTTSNGCKTRAKKHGFDGRSGFTPPLPRVKRHGLGGIHTGPPVHRMLMLRSPERESCAFPAALDFAPLASLLAKTFQKRRVSSAAANEEIEMMRKRSPIFWVVLHN
jgi:hypothetical protein